LKKTPKWADVAQGKGSKKRRGGGETAKHLIEVVWGKKKRVKA